MKMYLIGMPGSGKTTLGRQLAEKLMLPFIDLDKEIEQREGKSIAEIFTQQGEDYFRQIESQTLHAWAASAGSFVMATGGGAPCFYNGIETINQTGVSVFLDVPVAELLRRIQSKTERPMFNGGDLKEKEDRLISLRSTRLNYYEQAKIKTTSPDLAKLMQALKLA